MLIQMKKAYRVWKELINHITLFIKLINYLTREVKLI